MNEPTHHQAKRIRRGLLGMATGLCAALFAACTSAPPRAPGVVEVFNRQGQRLNPQQTLAAFQQADYILLGEVHDNPVHHRERARLLTALAERHPTVVFEQFGRSADAALQTPVQGDLDAWVSRAGFDLKGWRWPLHRPLIDAALAAQMPLKGGNLERDEVRQIARQGAVAAPADLAARLAQPLPAEGAAALDQGLVDGHCGQLSAAALPRMRDAQAARDAAMADAMVSASKQGAPLVLLIAGNGHVRRDHGVPVWLSRQQPSARMASVGFLEVDDQGRPPSLQELQPYDLVWVTSRAARSDPCEGMSLAPAGPPPAR
jgi:uncharacterized iron-regulated protein